MDKDRIRVLVADDHAILREGICSLLSLRPDIEVVGEAVDGREALEKVEALRPDVVLMDISMPGMDGVEATRCITEAHPETRVLVLTQHDQKGYIVSLLQAGAVGYVLKRAGGAEVVTAIRAAYQDGAFLPPGVAREVLVHYIHKPQEEDGQPHLTEREREVLKLIAEGLTTQEIAQQLRISAKTVMAHRANIMDKLDIHKSTELVRYAIRQGLVSL
ncbi:MAG: response regulator [Anaerolineae bacterium]